MRKKNLIVVLLAGCLASGCESYHSMQGYPPKQSHTEKEIKALTKLVNATDLTKIDTGKDKDARNTYIRNALVLTDLEYDKMTARLSGIKNGLDAGQQITVGALGAAGAIVGGGTSQILSAAVAATTAAGIAIDKTYFYNSTMPTMIAAMDAQRKAVYANIAIGLNKDYADYSIWAAYGDLELYYTAGTLPGAQSSINGDSSKKVQTANVNANNASVIATAQKTPQASQSDEQKAALKFYNAR